MLYPRDSRSDVLVCMGDENQEDDGSITYQDLETAAFHNNKEFVQHWLQNSDNVRNRNFQRWLGDLLRRAAYLHSYDVVGCLLSYGGRFSG